MMAQAATKDFVQETPRPSALVVFRLRAEARAILTAHGMMTLHDAVDALQSAALTEGLVEDIGQDAVQEIMSQAFIPWSEHIRQC